MEWESVHFSNIYSNSMIIQRDRGKMNMHGSIHEIHGWVMDGFMDGSKWNFWDQMLGTKNVSLTVKIQTPVKLGQMAKKNFFDIKNGTFLEF